MWRSRTFGCSALLAIAAACGDGQTTARRISAIGGCGTYSTGSAWCEGNYTYPGDLTQDCLDACDLANPGDACAALQCLEGCVIGGCNGACDQPCVVEYGPVGECPCFHDGGVSEPDGDSGVPGDGATAGDAAAPLGDGGSAGDGGPGDGATDGPIPDAGGDAGVTDGPIPDAGGDAGADAGDAGADAGCPDCDDGDDCTVDTCPPPPTTSTRRDVTWECPGETVADPADFCPCALDGSCAAIDDCDACLAAACDATCILVVPGTRPEGHWVCPATGPWTDPDGFCPCATGDDCADLDLCKDCLRADCDWNCDEPCIDEYTGVDWECVDYLPASCFEIDAGTESECTENDCGTDCIHTWDPEACACRTDADCTCEETCEEPGTTSSRCAALPDDSCEDRARPAGTYGTSLGGEPPAPPPPASCPGDAGVPSSSDAGVPSAPDGGGGDPDAGASTCPTQTEPEPVECDGHKLKDCGPCPSPIPDRAPPPDETVYAPNEKILNNLWAFLVPFYAVSNAELFCPGDVAFTNYIYNDRVLFRQGHEQWKVLGLTHVGVLSEHARVKIHLYNAGAITYRLFVNGHDAGLVSGSSCEWATPEVVIPSHWLKFPSQPHQREDNEFQLKVASNSLPPHSEVRLGWISVKFMAQAPIVLVHGITDDNQNCWNGTFGWAPELKRLGYTPVLDIDLECSGSCNKPGYGHQGYCDSIHNNAMKIRDELPNLLKSYGTQDVHLVGHSMGGLNLGGYLRLWYPGQTGTGPGQVRVLSFTTVATPHKGSVMAPVNGKFQARASEAPFIHDWDVSGVPPWFLEFSSGLTSVLSQLYLAWVNDVGPHDPGNSDLYPDSPWIFAHKNYLTLATGPFWALGFDADWENPWCNDGIFPDGHENCVSTAEAEYFFDGSWLDEFAHYWGASGKIYRFMARARNVWFGPWYYWGLGWWSEVTVDEIGVVGDPELLSGDGSDSGFMGNDFCVSLESARHPNATQNISYRGGGITSCTQPTLPLGYSHTEWQLHQGQNHISAIRMDTAPCVLYDSLQRIKDHYPIVDP